MSQSGFEPTTFLLLITKILCEINFGILQVQNLPFQHLEALNFDFYDFFALLEGSNQQ